MKKKSLYTCYFHGCSSALGIHFILLIYFLYALLFLKNKTKE